MKYDIYDEEDWRGIDGHDEEEDDEDDDEDDASVDNSEV